MNWSNVVAKLSRLEVGLYLHVNESLLTEALAFCEGYQVDKIY